MIMIIKGDSMEKELEKQYKILQICVILGIIGVILQILLLLMSLI